MIPVIRTYLPYLYLQTVLITAGPASQYRIQVSNTFTINVIFCPSKANTWSLKNISCNRNEPKQYTLQHMAIYRGVELNEVKRR